MLSVRRCLEVEDGSHVYLEPSLHVTWPEALTLVTPGRQLRAVTHDQTHVLSTAEAAGLVAAGLARAAGSRLMERPELSRAVFDWDAAAEIGYIAAELAEVADGQTGIEYGCGYGRLLLPLRRSGFALDGIDAAESTVRWLAGQPGVPAGSVLIGDISECAFPGRYGYALCGLNTLRYLPHLSALRRHLHLAALSVRPGGRYVIYVDSWTGDGGPSAAGEGQEWIANGLRVVWSVVRHDPLSRIVLESVVVHDGDREIVHEHHAQLALSVDEWHAVFEERSEWRVHSVSLDARPQAMPLADLTGPVNGNFWFVLDRTQETSGPLFTR